MSDPKAVTQLLRDWQAGDSDAFDQLYGQLHPELLRVAHHYLSRENEGHTLQTGGVVNEVYLRLVGSNAQVTDRSHFLALAARMMRRILVDHARSRARVKRGAGTPAVTLDESALISSDSIDVLLEVDEALERLAGHDRRMAEAIELVYFGGLDYDMAAEALGVSRSTLYADLKFAKAWLKEAMQ